MRDLKACAAPHPHAAAMHASCADLCSSAPAWPLSSQATLKAYKQKLADFARSDEAEIQIRAKAPPLPDPCAHL